MAYYFYEKYLTTDVKRYKLVETAKTERDDWDHKVSNTLHTSLSINENTGLVSMSNRASELEFYSALYYENTSDEYIKFISTNTRLDVYFNKYGNGSFCNIYSSDVSTNVYKVTLNKQSFVDTSLIEATIILAKDGTYPDEGEQDDYYYVKKELATTAKILTPDGGETLNKEFLVSWEDEQTGTYDIELSYNNGETWKRILTNVTGIDNEYNFKDETETSVGRLRIRNVYDEGNGHWVMNDGVFTIQHDFAPNKPSELDPFAGETLDATEAQVFSWKHNHPNRQSKFDLDWSTDQVDWNTITRSTTLNSQIIAGDIFPAGEIYWRVRTYSDVGIVSEWSDVAVFISALPSDAPEIVSSNIITGSKPIFEWSQGDQASYEIELLNSIGTPIWETGVVHSSNKAITSGIELQDGQTYTFRIRTATELDLWTEWSEQKITVSYTPPAKPNFTLGKSKGFIYLNISNPSSEGLQPEVIYNDVYRDGERIATKVSGNYKDYTVRSGQEYVYQVAAVGDNDTLRMSEVDSISLKLESSYLGNLLGNLVQLEINPAREESREQAGELMFFAGRSKPVMQYEEHISTSIPLAFKVLDDDTLDRFKEIANTKELLVYRDNRRRKAFGTITNYSVVDDTDHLGWYEISFTFQELDYSEVV